ncbi:MAG: GNAT family N-acetyltransferase [Nitrospirae bacterium]|nr:GNAT family N-acetyltransferase [Nitrospirota bacterium]
MHIFKKVDREKELGEVFSLRYQVYCVERGYERKENFLNNIEMDEYDAYAVHFIARIDNEPIGTARLILNNPLGFPTEKHCKLNISEAGLKRERTAEISRFAISKKAAWTKDCNKQEIVSGLFREMYQESKRLGIHYFCAAMERGLQRLLSRCGIVFLQAGPAVNYHGMRAPHISTMKDIEYGIFMKNIGLFNFITTSQQCPSYLTEYMSTPALSNPLV